MGKNLSAKIEMHIKSRGRVFEVVESFGQDLFGNSYAVVSYEMADLCVLQKTLEALMANNVAAFLLEELIRFFGTFMLIATTTGWNCNDFWATDN